ncbi:hypothetical protein OH77DRAFT_1485259 [Trametes cingulata]|nr:hypothetical protein OH77DRAFT_1485259 [Trametes cingulata]
MAAATSESGPTYPLPRYVYKILPSPPPTPIPEELPLSDLDRRDGFIHLSTAAQVPFTTSLFFNDHTSLSLLKVDTHTTLEQGGVYRWVENLPGCPHLYASRDGEWVNLGNANVVDWKEVKREEEQDWREVFKKLSEEGWLVDE